LIYSSKAGKAKDLITRAKVKDPGNIIYNEIWMNIEKSIKLKEEANNLVRDNKLDEALIKF
jgi:hypothetical protein